jgi:hypothetical protein
MNTPDPQRLGGLAWVRRTGGRLSPAERRRLLLEVAVGQWVNAVVRVKLALGRISQCGRACRDRYISSTRFEIRARG